MPNPRNNTTPAGDVLEKADYVQQVGEHEKDLVSIKERLAALEEKFGSNEKIADTLCETSEKAVRMDEMLGKRFLHLLKHDVGIKGEVTSLVNGIDRSFFLASLKRVGLLVVGVIYSIALLAVGAFISTIF